MNPDFIKAVKRLYPTARLGIDIVVEDNLDGKGPFLSLWNWPVKPPTDIEIKAAMSNPALEKTASDKLDAMLAMHGLTRTELKQALNDKP